ncbi:MAG: hypothetical protein ACQEUD_08160 [Bacillota bacterium]
MIGLTLFTAAGCANGEESTSVSVDTIDAEEVLRLDPDADIFQYDGVIYQTNIDWVEKLSLKKDAQIGEIQSRNETIQILKMECRISFLSVQGYSLLRREKIFY